MSEELKPTEPSSEPKPQPVKSKEHTKHKKVIVISLAALMVCLLFAVGFGGYNYGYRKGLEYNISQTSNTMQGGTMQGGPQGNFSQGTTDDSDDSTDDSTQSTAPSTDSGQKTPDANSNSAPNSSSDTQSGATTKSS